MAAWVVGGGLWLTGLMGLMILAGPADIGQPVASTPSFFVPTGTLSSYQALSGKYTVFTRSVRAAY
jgi:hypothetical protein